MDTKLPCVWCVCNLCKWSTSKGQLDTPPPDTQIPLGETSGPRILVSLVASLQSWEQTLHCAWYFNFYWIFYISEKKLVTVITPCSKVTYLIKECVYACVMFSWHGFFQNIPGKDEMHTLYNKVLLSDLHLHHRIYPAVQKKNYFYNIFTSLSSPQQN